MKINIAWLYPELLNLYGDYGNIVTFQKRLAWRNIDCSVTQYHLKDTIDFDSADLVFLGGGSDREQLLIAKQLSAFRRPFQEYVEKGGVCVAICGGYQLLGNYYDSASQRIEGLHILDIYTENGEGRLIGNTAVQSDLVEMPVVGFENHGGRTFIGSHKPLGEAKALGNNGIDHMEGVLYKNVLGTYLHGPLFPKNPQLCDYFLQLAIRRKDSGFAGLPPLDDELERKANAFMANRHNF